MEMMFSSANTDFLELYEPEIILLDNARIAEDSSEVDYFLEETGLTIEELKKNLGFKANKNHIEIPKGTKLKVISMNKSDRITIFEIKGLKIPCYLTYEADFVQVEVIPKNLEFEKVFISKNIPKQDTELTLYGINLYNLIIAINDIYNIDDKKYAYEFLKCLQKDKVIKAYNQYKEKLRMIDAKKAIENQKF